MSRKVKIRLAFDDWRGSWKEHQGKSIYNTEEGMELSLGVFHSGTIFEGEIVLEENSEKELNEALEKGYKPTFLLFETKGEE